MGLERKGKTFRREKIFMIGSIHLRRQAPLLEIVQTGDAMSGAFGPAKSGKKERRENCDHRNYDEQFNQRKSPSLP